MDADTSPVKAPSSSQCTLCTPSCTRGGRAAKAASRETAGGKTSNSCSDATPSSRSAVKNARVFAGPMCIFQLPAMTDTGLSGAIFERVATRQTAAREQLDRGAASGGDVRHPVGHAGAFHCCARVAAADHAERATLARGGDRVCDGDRARRERLDLED